MEIMKKFHWFWAWEDEKEEIWLREMSKKGWHFKAVSFPGDYIFEQGQPTGYVYRLDYFINRKDMDEYQQVFEDAGWDYMGEMNGWQYFRKEAFEDQELEIYTDNASKAGKYQRIMLFLVIFLPIYLNSILITSRMSDSDISQVVAIVMGLFFLIYVYAMLQLLLRIIQLRKNT